MILKWIIGILVILAAVCCGPIQCENGQEISFEEQKSLEASDGDGTRELEYDIKNPIIFASYTFDGDDYSYFTLLFECINGTYDSSNDMWDRTWSGTFRFRLIEAEPGVNIDSYEKGIISCPLQQAFAGPFQLYGKDYNGDGLTEFAITQTESFSGGDTGRIFALQKDGTVSEIPVKNDRRYVSAFGTINLQEKETGVFFDSVSAYKGIGRFRAGGEWFSDQDRRSI